MPEQHIFFFSFSTETRVLLLNLFVLVFGCIRRLIWLIFSSFRFLWLIKSTMGYYYWSHVIHSRSMQENNSAACLPLLSSTHLFNLVGKHENLSDERPSYDIVIICMECVVQLWTYTVSICCLISVENLIN